MTLQRYALLVESWNGVPTAPIHSAKKDLEDWNDFLRSCLGGAWSECEILPLHSPSSEEFLANVMSAVQKNDFLFIAYSGHGGRDAKGDYINITPNQVVYVNEIIERIPDEMPVTIILDACRSLRSLHEQTRSVYDDEDDIDYNQASSLIYWNKAFANINAGRVLIQSCAAGQMAASGPLASDNGFFTESMIAVAKAWACSASYGKILNTYEAYGCAVSYMQKKYGALVNSQHPQYTPSQNVFNPFAVRSKITLSDLL